MCSDWERIKAPAADQIVPYDSLPEATDKSILTKLAVLKVNGGLGTSMGGWRTKSLLARGSLMHVFRHSGMTGAKSALEVKDDMTFLDLTVRQIEVGVFFPSPCLIDDTHPERKAPQYREPRRRATHSHDVVQHTWRHLTYHQKVR